MACTWRLGPLPYSLLARCRRLGAFLHPEQTDAGKCPRCEEFDEVSDNRRLAKSISGRKVTDFWITDLFLCTWESEACFPLKSGNFWMARLCQLMSQCFTLWVLCTASFRWKIHSGGTTHFTFFLQVSMEDLAHCSLLERCLKSFQPGSNSNLCVQRWKIVGLAKWCKTDSLVKRVAGLRSTCQRSRQRCFLDS